MDILYISDKVKTIFIRRLNNLGYSLFIMLHYFSNILGIR